MKVALYEYVEGTDFVQGMFSNRRVKEIRISEQVVADLTGLKSLEDTIDEQSPIVHPWTNLLDLNTRRSDFAAGQIGTMLGTRVTTDAYDATINQKLPGRSILVFYEDQT
jgi:hypothetical protein